MFKILRMICAVIAAACAVACVIVAVNWGMIPFWGCLAGGIFFFVLCLLFKFLQEENEGTADQNGEPADHENERPAVSSSSDTADTTDRDPDNDSDSDNN